MLGSATLEVAIGLLLAFLLFSLIMSAICESLESFLKTRARELERSIAEVLEDPEGNDLRSKFYDHPLIYALYRGTYKPRDFSNSKVIKKNDAVAPPPPGARVGDPTPETEKVVDFQTPFGGFLTRFTGARAKPSYIPPQHFVTALLDMWKSGVLKGKVQAALGVMSQQSGGDESDLRLRVEGWYDGLMERVTGTYKRNVQQFMLVVGFFVAMLLNLDALVLVRELSTNPTLRGSLLATADKIVADANTPDAKKVTEEAAARAVKLTTDAEQARQAAHAAAEAAKAEGAGETERAKADETEAAAVAAEEAAKVANDDAVDARLAQVGVKDLIDAANEAEMPMGWSHPTAADKRECFFGSPTTPTLDGKEAKAEAPTPAATTDTAAKPPVKAPPDCMKVTSGALLGWAIMALAGTLGAPFWFDLLSKFVNIRSTVKAAEDSVQEKLKAREKEHAKAPVVVVAPEAPGRETPADPGGPVPDRVQPFEYG